MTQWTRGWRRVSIIMYKPSRIYFRRQEACDSLALDFSNMEGSSVGEEESSKEVRRVEASKEQGGWTQEMRERQQRGSHSESETQSQRKF